MRNSLHNPGHWGSSLSFCPSLLAPSRIFETNSHTSKNKTRFKYSHAKCSWPTQFWSHNRFKGCTVVPYHRPALHPCLPLHLPALLCLQALCPAHPPHHPPHTELEYIQILRKKRKENKHYTVKKFYTELYQPFILEIFINYCQNKKPWNVSPGETSMVKWHFQTPTNQGMPALGESPRQLPWKLPGLFWATDVVKN